MTKHESMQALDRAYADLAGELDAVPENALDFTPGGDDWPIRQIFRHLGTGITFRIDLENLRGSSDPFPGYRFGDYNAAVNASSGMNKSELLQTLDEEFRRYDNQLKAVPDDAWSSVYPVTMPSGRVLEISAEQGVNATLEHFAEHAEQIKRYLAERPKEKTSSL
jgi:hypothetical protein